MNYHFHIIRWTKRAYWGEEYRKWLAEFLWYLYRLILFKPHYFHLTAFNLVQSMIFFLFWRKIYWLTKMFNLFQGWPLKFVYIFSFNWIQLFFGSNPVFFLISDGVSNLSISFNSILSECFSFLELWNIIKNI